MKKNTLKSDRKHVIILKIKLNSTSIGQVLGLITQKIARHEKFYVVTPNPEIVLQAQNDPELMKILNQADLSLPDGVGLKLADPKLPMIPGRVLMFELCRLANTKSWRIFLLGGRPGVVQKAAGFLQKNFPKIDVNCESGPILDKNGRPVSEVDRKVESDCLDKVGIMQPQILFVGFGCPKQEKWVAQHLSDLPIGGAMVVGGAFDYLAGTAKLPPAWLEKLGLEWLWRLIQEPWRAPRIFKAVILFPLTVILERIFKKENFN